MGMSAQRRRSFYALEWVLLGACVLAAGMLSRAEDWRPLALTGLLLVLTVWGDRLNVRVRGQNLSAAFVALVLTFVLLGPAPAVAIGLLAGVVDAAARRLTPPMWLNNLLMFAAIGLLGGLLGRLLLGDIHATAAHHKAPGVALPLVVVAVFFATNALNFFIVAANKRALEGTGLVHQVRTLLIPILPSQIAAATLAAILAIAYVHLGYSALLFAVIVVLVFQYLAIALLRSEDRRYELESHAQRLATLQLGVLVTLMETLQLRDPMTARHAAAVARYARDLAAECGLDERDQDHAHTAGLLHDIGKFAFPDRVLHATGELSASDWQLVRRHPQDGATLVGRLDGYGPVAETILYHHERIDGAGYPVGLIGNELPLLSRIIAVCEVYDVLTARDSYRPVLTPRDAFVELRVAAGTQLDADVVERFIAMLERQGPASMTLGDTSRFEDELDFERRARALAQPTA
jgi:putative nucleotidyltransferase with HDIG domain